VKVILVKDDRAVGRKGQVLDVTEGYARNFLFPQGLAVPASEGNVRSLREDKDAAQRKEDRGLAAARKIETALDGLEITIKMKSGETGRLFGAVTAKMITDAIQERAKVELDRRRLGLESPIKALGTYTLPIRLHPQVECRVILHVEPI
jgi:large subunit ribosomal protein L9